MQLMAPVSRLPARPLVMRAGIVTGLCLVDSRRALPGVESMPNIGLLAGRCNVASALVVAHGVV